MKLLPWKATAALPVTLLWLSLQTLVLLSAVPSSVTQIRLVAHADSVYDEIYAILQRPETAEIMNGYVLRLPGNQRSAEYTWNDFVQAYRQMTSIGLGSSLFAHGNSVEAGIVNIALFLSQAMQETIQYDACDENNWSIGMAGVPDYPLSAACGQAGQDYSQYRCWSGTNGRNVQCPIDNQMTVQARTWATWSGSPPPLFCAPRDLTGGGTPRWDYSAAVCPTVASTMLDFPNPYLQDAVLDAIDTDRCNAYPGQASGAFSYSNCGEEGCPNAQRIDTSGGSIHTDVEGCCWWGRGVIQTTGPCNTGKLNYYLTGTYYDNNGNAQKEIDMGVPFPQLNLCAQPGLICNGPKEIKWLSGMFFWIFDIQTFANGGGYNFHFLENLQENGPLMFENPTFNRGMVDAVSGLLNRGCPARNCPGAGPVHALEGRYGHFLTALAAIRHASDPDTYPPPPGTPAGEYLGPWYSKEVLCKACENTDALCALKWHSGGEALCVSWASTPAQCDASGGAATAWCDETDPDTEPPTLHPTNKPTTQQPTGLPETNMPTHQPTDLPETNVPTKTPTLDPTLNPTFNPTMNPTLNPTFNPTLDPTLNPTFNPTFNPTDPSPTELPTVADDTSSGDDMSHLCTVTVNRDDCRELMTTARQRRFLAENDEDHCECYNFCGMNEEGCSLRGEQRVLKCAAHSLVAGCTIDDTSPAPTPPLPTCGVLVNDFQCADFQNEQPLSESSNKDDPDCECRSWCNGVELECCKYEESCVLLCDGDLVSGCPVHAENDDDEDDNVNIWNGRCELEVDLDACSRLMTQLGDDKNSQNCPCAHFCDGQFSGCCGIDEYCAPECIDANFVGGCDVSLFE